jgi:hypothetical protein
MAILLEREPGGFDITEQSSRALETDAKAPGPD